MNRNIINPVRWGVLTLLSLVSALVFAQEQSAPATLLDDSTIYNDQRDANGGGYSGVCVGNLGSTSSTRRGLIRYQLPEIPVGATITRVTLSMTQNRVRFQGPGAPKPATLRLKRAIEPWTEGTQTGSNAACGGGTAGSGVSWNTRPETAETDTGSAALNTSNGFVFTLDTDSGVENDGLITDVQAWVDGAANEGWELSLEEENDADNARRIDPGTLTVYWTASQEPGFAINPGLNDAWWNADFDGQGFSFTVFPDLGFFFVTWYTYELERPTEDVANSALLGEAGHRWLSAYGFYESGRDTVELTIENSVGGVFHSELPEVNREDAYGTMTIQFHGCNSATLTYDIPSLTLMGTMDVTRVATDNVAICEALLMPME
jgi:hypothetical protein